VGKEAKNMSPEMWKGPKNNLKKILDEPDKSGTYITSEGDTVHVDMDLLHPLNKVNVVVLRSKTLLAGKPGSPTLLENGWRFIKLNRKGIGIQMLQGGDLLQFISKNERAVAKPINNAWKRPENRHRGRYW
jgi:hypothetical protein